MTFLCSASTFIKQVQLAQVHTWWCRQTWGPPATLHLWTPPPETPSMHTPALPVRPLTLQHSAHRTSVELTLLPCTLLHSPPTPKPSSTLYTEQAWNWHSFHVHSCTSLQPPNPPAHGTQNKHPTLLCILLHSQSLPQCSSTMHNHKQKCSMWSWIKKTWIW